MVHLFNPENDLALASGLEHFTPPKGALAIRRAGQWLPMFWASDGDTIICDRPVDENLVFYAGRYGLCGNAAETIVTDSVAMPWGWSMYTRNELMRRGISAEAMPDPKDLEKLRALSHRRTSITINRALGIPDSMLSVEAATTDEALEAIRRWGEAVIKLPWSSSGRGVFYSSQIPAEKLESYIGGMISRQGSVTVEPKLNRLQDFAALFHCDDKKAEYRGLSVFATNHAGFYEGNIVAPQKQLSRRLGADIRPITDELEKVLSDIIAPHYNGWLGIDMMKYISADGRQEIAPCIEMNLRMTMGVAALHAAEKVYSVERSEMLLKVSPEGVCLRRM